MNSRQTELEDGQSLRPALSPFGSNLLRSFAAARFNRFCKEK